MVQSTEMKKVTGMGVYMSHFLFLQENWPQHLKLSFLFVRLVALGNNYIQYPIFPQAKAACVLIDLCSGALAPWMAHVIAKVSRGEITEVIFLCCMIWWYTIFIPFYTLYIYIFFGPMKSGSKSLVFLFFSWLILIRLI